MCGISLGESFQTWATLWPNEFGASFESSSLSSSGNKKISGYRNDEFRPCACVRLLWVVPRMSWDTSLKSGRRRTKERHSVHVARWSWHPKLWMFDSLHHAASFFCWCCTRYQLCSSFDRVRWIMSFCSLSRQYMVFREVRWFASLMLAVERMHDAISG